MRSKAGPTRDRCRDHTVWMAVCPDYESDPGRWGAWHPAEDVHDAVGPELRGPILDVGCGEGRLRRSLRDGVAWIGVDSSWAQLTAGSRGPVVQADMRALPFRDGTFEEVTHLWCLYHVDDPVTAIREASRVLRPGGRYYACTNARTSDAELMPEGYPPSPFDAEEAAGIVEQVFESVAVESWDQQLYTLETREEVIAFCRSHFIPLERAHQVEVPLRPTKRGSLVRATSNQPSQGA